MFSHHLRRCTTHETPEDCLQYHDILDRTMPKLCAAKTVQDVDAAIDELWQTSNVRTLMELFLMFGIVPLKGDTTRDGDRFIIDLIPLRRRLAHAIHQDIYPTYASRN